MFPIIVLWLETQSAWICIHESAYVKVCVKKGRDWERKEERKGQTSHKW